MAAMLRSHGLLLDACYRLAVTMHRPNDPGYSHSNSYVIDDWR